jgi:hypothetical protein
MRAMILGFALGAYSSYANIVGGARGNVRAEPRLLTCLVRYLVMTAMPLQPNAAKVLRSAAMPAPPLESEPAIERTLGIMSRASDQIAHLAQREQP